MTLAILLVAALAVSALVGTVARLPTRQLLVQTLAMFAAVLFFYGLVALL